MVSIKMVIFVQGPNTDWQAENWFKVDFNYILPMSTQYKGVHMLDIQNKRITLS